MPKIRVSESWLNLATFGSGSRTVQPLATIRTPPTPARTRMRIIAFFITCYLPYSACYRFCSRSDAAAGPDHQFGRQSFGLGAPALQKLLHRFHRRHPKPELRLPNRRQRNGKIFAQQNVPKADN